MKLDLNLFNSSSFGRAEFSHQLSLHEEMLNAKATDRFIAHFRIPVQKHVSKKNNRPIWNGRIGKSKNLLFAESHMHRELLKHKLQNQIQTITGPLHVVFLFRFPLQELYLIDKETKQVRLKKTAGDLSNLYELPQDCLTKVGIIDDDSQITSHDLSRRLITHDDNYLLEIYLLKPLY